MALAGCEGAGTPPAPAAIPTVTITAEAASVTENDSLNFSVQAEPVPRTDLNVAVKIAYHDCELEPSSYSVKIVSGASGATLAAPTSGAAGCTVTATIAAGEGYRVGRAADASASADVTAATPTRPVEPVVTIAADRSSVAEGDDLHFTLTATPPPESDLEVTVNWSDPGSFLTDPGRETVTILAADGSAVLRAATDDDSADERDGEVTVAISPGGGYTIGSPRSATVAVADNDASPTGSTPAPRSRWVCPKDIHCPIVDVAADAAEVEEGNPVSFTLTANPAPAEDSPITVSLQWTLFRRRFGPTPETVTFDAGSSTASVTVQTIENLDDDGETRITLLATRNSASASNAYGLGEFIDTVVVEDDD